MLALAPASVPRPLRWWVWPVLLAMLAGVACKPRQKVCYTERFFRVLEPPQDGGMSFSMDPLGPELKGYVLVQQPTTIIFEGDTPTRLEWVHGDLAGGFQIAYSDKEVLARDLDGKLVFPIKRLSGIFSDRIHLGFRTIYCVGTKFYPCPQKEIYAVADMSCTWEELDQ